MLHAESGNPDGAQSGGVPKSGGNAMSPQHSISPAEVKKNILEAVVKYLEHGFSVIPTNREKRATIPWKIYQSTRMTPETAMEEFRNGAFIAVVGGAVSGNLECLDFDKIDLYPAFMDILRENDSQLASILVKRKTPSGGYHLIYRCDSPVSGNRKLATSADGKDTWIETRGENGYFLTYPSPGYEIIEHDLTDVPVISAEQVSILHALAESFSAKIDASIRNVPKYDAAGERPGDAFNQTADIRQMLASAGWTCTGKMTAGGELLTRPGKSKGTSATLKDGCLYVFSSNAGIPLGGHLPFSVFAHLSHGGDYNAAARALKGVDGCGISTTPRTPAQNIDEEWPEPLPLSPRVEPLPYPLDAFPDTAKRAISELQAFVQAPIPLVATCCLSALSAAIQPHIDVKRAEGLTGPSSLFALAVADSGERKSTVDSFFAKAIKDYQAEQAEAFKPVLRDFNAAFECWKSKRAGILDSIKNLAKGGKSTVEAEKALAELEHQKPEMPRIPRILRGDETPESLSWKLSREWPSGAVISSEAGSIFGAHGMGQGSVMRNLSLLNILWDGGELPVGRKTSESFTVRGARLSMGLQIQAETLNSFFSRTGGLPRGTGFLARFIIAWPESTQGERDFVNPPAGWPAMAAFNRRISEILNHPVEMDEDGGLLPKMMEMSNQAFSNWVDFHNTIEKELRQGGELFDVRDIASKIADNAARIAAIFQVFQHGMSGKISISSMQAAISLSAWHLNESRRFLGEIAITPEHRNAVLLQEWLMDYCKKNKTEKVIYRDIQRLGPNPIRLKESLDAALMLLEGQACIKISEDSPKTILINPGLLK